MIFHWNTCKDRDMVMKTCLLQWLWKACLDFHLTVPFNNHAGTKRDLYVHPTVFLIASLIVVSRTAVTYINFWSQEKIFRCTLFCVIFTKSEAFHCSIYHRYIIWVRFSSILTLQGKKWLSTTMLSLMDTSRNSGRIM